MLSPNILRQMETIPTYQIILSQISIKKLLEELQQTTSLTSKMDSSIQILQTKSKLHGEACLLVSWLSLSLISYLTHLIHWISKGTCFFDQDILKTFEIKLLWFGIRDSTTYLYIILQTTILLFSMLPSTSNTARKPIGITCLKQEYAQRVKQSKSILTSIMMESLMMMVTIMMQMEIQISFSAHCIIRLLIQLT